MTTFFAERISVKILPPTRIQSKLVRSAGVPAPTMAILSAGESFGARTSTVA